MDFQVITCLIKIKDLISYNYILTILIILTYFTIYKNIGKNTGSHIPSECLLLDTGTFGRFQLPLLLLYAVVDQITDVISQSE